MKKTIALDFDGVVHSYKSGWQGLVPTDPPTHGAKQAIAKLRENYDVVIFSTRCEECGGINAIEHWLEVNDIEVNDVVSGKPMAVLVVDDRAFRFQGDWGAVVAFASNPENLLPWNKKPLKGQLGQ